MNSNPPLCQALGISNDELEHWLGHYGPRPANLTPQRRRSRHPYRVQNGIWIKVYQREMLSESVQVAPKNLAALGIVVLRRGPMDLNLRVELSVPISPAGNFHVVVGRVIQCDHIVKAAHEVGIAFREPIDIAPILASPCNVAAPKPSHIQSND